MLHRPSLGLSYLFKGHAQVHHGLYRSDSAYVTGDREPEELTLSWWLLPALVMIHIPPAIGLYLLFGLPSAFGLLAAIILYHTAFEYLHYCMHVPQGRWFERRWLFRWINDHHMQHHRKHFTNLNVVLPIADYIFGTRRRCTNPTAMAITQEVGYLPAYRRPPLNRFFRRAGRETKWLLGLISRRVLRVASAVLP